MEKVTIPEDHHNEELRGRKINTGIMLGAGWLLFLLSQILNYLYYKMHPSSPEMGTWGEAEKVEEEWVEDGSSCGKANLGCQGKRVSWKWNTSSISLMFLAAKAQLNYCTCALSVCLSPKLNFSLFFMPLYTLSHVMFRLCAFPLCPFVPPFTCNVPSVCIPFVSL